MRQEFSYQDFYLDIGSVFITPSVYPQFPASPADSDSPVVQCFISRPQGHSGVRAGSADPTLEFLVWSVNGCEVVEEKDVECI